VPLGQTVALLNQRLVTVLVEVVHPHDPFLVTADRGP
jgi:hypothetical protein